MEVVLIQGEEDTGKTTLCKMIEERLLIAGYEVLKDDNMREMRFPRVYKGVEKDFTAVYIKGECKVILNSESETNGINNLIEIFKSNFEKHTVLITAIRPEEIDAVKPERTLNNRIKKAYGNLPITDTIFLEKQQVDYSSYLTKILLKEGLSIYKKITLKLKCKIEIDCSSIIKKC